MHEQTASDYFPLFSRHIQKLSEHGPELRGLCPFHDDHNPSWSGNRVSGLWQCFGCQASGNAEMFASRIGEQREASNGHQQRRIVDTYDYCDENGLVLFQVVRFDPKGFRQRRPDGNNSWIWNLEGIRRVLYRLPKIMPAETVYIVEGEKDTDRLWSLGIPATTSPQGAGNWYDEYSESLRDKHVVILPDNDEVGKQHAQKVARSLLAVTTTVKIVCLPDLPPKGDVSDWLDQGHTKEELAEIITAAPILTPEEAYTDQTHHKESEHHSESVAGQWPILAEEALHGLAGDIVRSTAPYTEADSVAVLLNIVVAFGNCINATAHAKVQHDNHPARLFVVQVGDSSKGRKGTGWSTPRHLLSHCDHDWSKDRVKSGLSSGEGLIYNVRDPVWKKEPIKEKGRIVDSQDVCVDEGESDKRLLIVEPEFASVLTVANREGNTLSEIIRQAWDNGNLSPLTKSNPIKAINAHISLIGHITKQELLARLDDTSKANGFANRFLWALVKRSKELPEGEAAPDNVLSPLAERLREVITFSRTVSEVKRDDEARALWAEVYHALSEGKPGLLGAVLSRAEAQVLRLSVIYALLDKSPVVRVEHLRAALAVWEYCEQSAIIIFGQRLGDPTADRILEAIRNASSAGMSDKDIYELFGKHKSANERTRSVSLLLSLGLIKAEKHETGGRPRTVYRTA